MNTLLATLINTLFNAKIDWETGLKHIDDIEKLSDVLVEAKIESNNDKLVITSDNIEKIKEGKELLTVLKDFIEPIVSEEIYDAMISAFDARITELTPVKKCTCKECTCKKNPWDRAGISEEMYRQLTKLASDCADATGVSFLDALETMIWTYTRKS